MNPVFVFDIDGTLTPPRKKMEEDFIKYFRVFCWKHEVYLCTGSDWSKVKEQIPDSILKHVRGIFTCSGNSYRHGLIRVGEEEASLHRDYYPSVELLADLRHFVNISKCPKRTSNHIEQRTGMINFSTIGRDCTSDERKEYSIWDSKTNERKNLVETLYHKYQDLSFNIGGEISIDIHPKGWDKSRAIKLIKSWHPDSKICFFGDKIHQGGNDMPAAESLSPLDYVCPVRGPEETRSTLEGFFVRYEAS